MMSKDVLETTIPRYTINRIYWQSSLIMARCYFVWACLLVRSFVTFIAIFQSH